MIFLESSTKGLTLGWQKASQKPNAFNDKSLQSFYYKALDIEVLVWVHDRVTKMPMYFSQGSYYFDILMYPKELFSFCRPLHYRMPALLAQATLASAEVRKGLHASITGGLKAWGLRF